MSIEEEIYDELVKRFEIGEVLFPTTIDDKYRTVYWKEFIKLVCVDLVSGQDLYNALGLRNASGLARYFKKYAPNILQAKGNTYFKTFLFSVVSKRKCSKCKQILSNDNYYYSNGAYSTSCKSCTIHEASLNKERKALYDKNRSVQNKDKKSLYDKDYYLKNRDKKLLQVKTYRLYNSEKAVAAIRTHYYNNRHMYVFYSAKRRAAKLQATPNWANLVAMKEIYATCPPGFHVDHIVPLQNDIVCGLHCEFNLQHLSAHDNLSKGNKYEP